LPLTLALLQCLLQNTLIFNIECCKKSKSTASYRHDQLGEASLLKSMFSSRILNQTMADWFIGLHDQIRESVTEQQRKRKEKITLNFFEELPDCLNSLFAFSEETSIMLNKITERKSVRRNRRR
jgi:hypothetical protein